MLDTNHLDKVEISVDGIRYEEKEIINALRAIDVEVNTRSFSEHAFDLNDNSTRNKVLCLVRIPSYFKRTATASALKASGAVVLNPPAQITTFGRKSSTDRWLSDNGLPNIPAYCVTSQDTAKIAASQLKYPVVIKPDIGGFGRRVHLIKNENQLEQLIETTLELAPPYNRIIYLQRRVDVDLDLRIIVLFGKIIGIMSRTNECSFAKNISRGGTGEMISPDLLPKALLHKISRALPTGLFGVDVFVAKDGSAYICEINANCQFKEFDRVADVKVAPLLAQRIKIMLSSYVPLKNIGMTV